MLKNHNGTVISTGRYDQFADVPLLGGEINLAAAMVESRLREFRAGRGASRLALRELGAEDCPLLWGRCGEPLWPVGFVGSISHVRGYVAAIAAESTRFASVGLDIDDSRPIDEGTAGNLMFPSEISLIREFGKLESDSAARRFVFSAKEALYKCQYPVTGDADLDFLDVQLCRRGQELGAIVVNRNVAQTPKIVSLIRIGMEVLENGPVLAVAVLPEMPV